MNRLLEELRAQRQLIQQHLEWLEQKITQVEHEATDARTSAAGRPAPTKIAALQPPPTGTVRATAQVEAVCRTEAQLTRPSGAIPTDQQNDSWPGFASPVAPAGDPIRQAKIGCLILFALASGLFLFLLFGLPYMFE